VAGAARVAEVAVNRPFTAARPDRRGRRGWRHANLRGRDAERLPAARGAARGQPADLAAAARPRRRQRRRRARRGADRLRLGRCAPAPVR